ncbi:NAD-dependent epimerase/dehydratase family protein [Exiguobacterium sp. TDN 0502]|uniref:NAD-dependent epimerase/dehydratase family protein n=1 Tax=Exiguobacterium sp. TDN 0502 TaxID=3420731 RepID=UPI003D77722D
MKSILITGKNGYISKELVKKLSKEVDIEVDTISLKTNEWQNTDFKKYDVVIHLAGIAHFSTNESQKENYYAINRDLTEKVALKSKNEGVKKFIFMSSIIIYGNKEFKKIIKKDTLPNPSDFYGDSKLQAEKKLENLRDGSFEINIVRSPLVYGGEVKGNYYILEKYSKFIFIFPYIKNKRSMIHINNLCEFLRILSKKEKTDRVYYFPQDKEYVSTNELIKRMNPNSIQIKFISNFLIKVFKKNIYFKKLFGTLVYDKSLSDHEWNYTNPYDKKNGC